MFILNLLTMKKKLKYIITFVWFSYLIVSSILLFSRGFLLTRNVQENNATCNSRLEPFCMSEDDKNCLIRGNESLDSFYDEAHRTCIKPQFRVILLIVDALRYDFTVFDEDITDPLPYQNKLPVLRHVLESYPESSRLFKFIADPPTTTMQRLKALTTGSLPTFIDAGSNFATSEINEDNVIDQVVRNNYSVVFMGDDTWASLYPNRFSRHYPYPSFDVWDLDTVDNGVRKNIFPELQKNDWNLLVGHFLGVDHCGHRYGPNHIEMARKLTEINEVIKNVIDEMSNDTVLFVVGDHGMTATGDHGGESSEETNAAMFVHSKRPLLPYGAKNEAVKQVDLVPTLSAILGVPIPFQNLGILIYSALPSTNITYPWKLPLFWLWNNAQQVFHYIKVYSETTDTFDEDYLDLYDQEFETLRLEISSVVSEDDFERFSGKTIGFLEKVRTLCEEVWIQFDPFSITNGLTFLFLAIFFMYIISDGIPLQHISHCIENSFISALCLVLLLTTVSVGIIEMSNLADNVYNTFVFVANVVSPLMFVVPIIQNWEFISTKWYTRKVDVVALVCRVVLLFNVVLCFSNSLINEEASVQLFLLMTVFLTVIVRLAWYKQETRKPVMKQLFCIISLLMLLRGSMYFWRCRVEQQWCFASPHELGNLSKSPATKREWIISVVSLFLLANASKLWLRHCGNLSGYSITQFLHKIIPLVMVVCTTGYWILRKSSANTLANKRNVSYLALSVYGLSGLSIIAIVMRPVCISILARNGTYNEDEGSLISSIYNKLKANLDNKSKDIPIIYGLGTAFSAVYVMLAVNLVMIFALVLGDGFAFSTFIIVAVGAFFLFVTSLLRIKQAQTLDDLLNVPTLTVLGWILLAQYFFYATGHQPAFPNINWEAAFVGTSGIFSHRYILGSLIIINTFGSYIIMGILLPLLIITPFTLFVMMPSIIAKNDDFSPYLQKGEMVLYERSKLVYASIFSLCCKYVSGFSIKVFASMLAATIHCRHLMVWNVFAPKFIFEGVAMFVTLASVLLGYLLFIRVHNQIEKCITKLNKIS